MDKTITFADRLREAMELRQVKQIDLVLSTGIGKSAISQYLSGQYEPKQKSIYKIAQALNVNEAWLMGFEGAPIERSGFGALDPVLPPNMKGCNLDGAKIDADFLFYMISNLSGISNDLPQYIRTKNNILALAHSSGLDRIANMLIKKMEKDIEDNKMFLQSDKISNEHLALIKSLSKDDLDTLISIARQMRQKDIEQ